MLLWTPGGCEGQKLHLFLGSQLSICPNEWVGGRDFLEMLAKEVIMLQSKTTTQRGRLHKDGSGGPCGIGVTARRLRGGYEKVKRAKERRDEGKDGRVRLAGEGGDAKLSAEEQRREGWRMMREGEPIVLLT